MRIRDLEQRMPVMLRRTRTSGFLASAMGHLSAGSLSIHKRRER